MEAAFKEISAKTVEDAITKACIEMETSSDNLEIQVVREGSSGFLGIGSKPAIIKVRKKAVEEEPAIEPVKQEEKKEIKKEETKEKVIVKETVKEEEKESKEEKKEAKKQEKSSEKVGKKKNKNDHKENRKKENKPKAPEKKEYVIVERSEEEINQMKNDADVFLKDVFKAMELPVNIEISYEKETGTLDIEFNGEDMGVLIGKRGQTLDSIQYLTSLVVNKNVESYVRVKLDTENYRSRRKDTLENLAKNIAYKVRKTRKPVSLEPMNPYERRIIHSALQGNKYVETYSEGNEPYRHVVITYKRQ